MKEPPRPFYNSIFWVEVEKIKPNPFQPRREFDGQALNELADSIRQYGVLQPLVVTRKELENEEGIVTEYELIAGERRLRASKIAGLVQVPVVIRVGEESDQLKLELAIIENLQREDLNPVDRAKAFQRLAKDFGYRNTDIAQKVGKSREYVSNTIRILGLPEEIIQGLVERKITEGHSRPLLMLNDRPQEQLTVFKEIVAKGLTVRDTEQISRKIAVERVRRKDLVDPELIRLEKELSEKLGTRVQIERRERGGKVVIDFFSTDDLQALLSRVAQESIALATEAQAISEVVSDASLNTPKEDDSDLYSVRNFSL